MRARVGDRIIIASHTVGRPVRDGEIVEVRGPGGGPPYLVRWTDNASMGLVYPGSDAHLSRDDAAAGAAPSEPESGPANEPPHVRSWRVDIELYEAGDDTTAHAVLVAESPRRLDARGQAHREPGDFAVPEIGDEIAVARSLRRLADRLMETASSDIQGIQPGHADITG